MQWSPPLTGSSRPPCKVQSRNHQQKYVINVSASSRLKEINCYGVSHLSVFWSDGNISINSILLTLPKLRYSRFNKSILLRMVTSFDRFFQCNGCNMACIFLQRNFGLFLNHIRTSVWIWSGLQLCSGGLKHQRSSSSDSSLALDHSSQAPGQN